MMLIEWFRWQEDISNSSKSRALPLSCLWIGASSSMQELVPTSLL